MIDPNEPTDPIESIEPTLPMDRIEYAEPIDRIEPSDRMDRMDRRERLLRIERGDRAVRSHVAMFSVYHSARPVNRFGAIVRRTPEQENDEARPPEIRRPGFW